MKKFMLVMVIFMQIIIFSPIHICYCSELDSAIIVGKVSESKYIKKANKILEKMENAIYNIPPTGDNDVDFLNMMIVLKREEAKLSFTVKEYTKDPKFKDYIDYMIYSEGIQVVEMDKIRLQLLSGNKHDSIDAKEYIQDYKNILKRNFDRLSTYETVGDMEKDYLNLMELTSNIHIELSKNIMEHSNNDLIKKISKSVINIKVDQGKVAEEIIRQQVKI